MNIFFKLFFAIFLLSACAPVSVVVPTAIQPAQPEVILESETPLPTKTPVPSFTSTPTLLPFPTLSYYSIPSRFHLVYIKMIDDVNGWGQANYDASGIFRLVRTSDGGKSWIDVSPFERLGVTRNFYLDAETVWVKEFSYIEDEEFLYFTQNGGKTWEMLSPPPEDIESIYFIDKFTGWAVSGSHILYQTTDGGQTWNKFLANSLIEDNEILFRGTANVWTINDDPTTSGFKNLYVSWDDGKTWEVKNMPFKHEIFSDAHLAKMNLPVFFGDKLGYVTAQYVKQTGDVKFERLIAVFATDDGGHTWMQRSYVNQNLSKPDYVDFVSSDIAFTTCDAGLCITKDGAQTWQVVQLNQAQSDFFDKVDSFDVDFVTDLKGWLLTWKIGVGTDLYFTNDSGKTWIPLPVKVYRKD